MNTCPKGYTCDCMCCPEAEKCSGVENPRYQDFLEHALVASGNMVREAEKQAERNFDHFSVRCKHRKMVNYRKGLTAPGCNAKKSPFDWGCSLNACPFVVDGVYSWTLEGTNEKRSQKKTD